MQFILHFEMSVVYMVCLEMKKTLFLLLRKVSLGQKFTYCGMYNIFTGQTFMTSVMGSGPVSCREIVCW